jgi:hypothetical protein
LPTYPFSGDSKGNEIIHQLKDVFQSNSCFISIERHVLFVCGGTAGVDNQRTRFLAFAQSAFPKLRILLAEDAYGDFLADSSNRVLNLALFEKVLAQLADCILIFPESPGSFAELGFFSAYKPLIEKTLAVSPLALQSHDSFIALGPLARVNRASEYSPVLLSTNDFAATHSDISQRLARLAPPKRRKHLTFAPWNEYSLKHKFFLTFEIARILRIVHAATAPHVLKDIFGGYVSKPEIRHIVAVLVAAKLLKRGGDDDRYLSAISQRSFVEIPGDEELLTATNNYLLDEHQDLYRAMHG